MRSLTRLKSGPPIIRVRSGGAAGPGARVEQWKGLNECMNASAESLIGFRRRGMRGRGGPWLVGAADWIRRLAGRSKYHGRYDRTSHGDPTRLRYVSIRLHARATSDVTITRAIGLTIPFRIDRSAEQITGEFVYIIGIDAILMSWKLFCLLQFFSRVFNRRPWLLKALCGSTPRLTDRPVTSRPVAAASSFRRYRKGLASNELTTVPTPEVRWGLTKTVEPESDDSTRKKLVSPVKRAARFITAPFYLQHCNIVRVLHCSFV